MRSCRPATARNPGLASPEGSGPPSRHRAPSRTGSARSRRGSIPASPGPCRTSRAGPPAGRRTRGSRHRRPPRATAPAALPARAWAGRPGAWCAPRASAGPARNSGGPGRSWPERARGWRSRWPRGGWSMSAGRRRWSRRRTPRPGAGWRRDSRSPAGSGAGPSWRLSWSGWPRGAVSAC